MYKHDFTTSEKFLKDFATAMTTNLDKTTPNSYWILAYPANLDAIDKRVVFQVTTQFDRQWTERDAYVESVNPTPEAGTYKVSGTPSALRIHLKGAVAKGGGVRVMVRDSAGKSTNLYFEPNSIINAQSDNPFEFCINPESTEPRTELICHSSLEGKTFYISYEQEVVLGDVEEVHYVSLLKPATVQSVVLPQQTTPNHYHVEWCIGTDFTAPTDPQETEASVIAGFAVDHYSIPSKLSWFKHQANTESIAKSWMPIEYWVSFDNNCVAGVVMGDPGLSIDDIYGYLSSPFYFGKVDQIEGALHTDLKGNFAGAAGSYYAPSTGNKTYGDYTGNGATDVIMASSKSGRPYNMHKISVFGAYEFEEKTFSSQSAHTGKHAVSDIVVGDIHENDRGKLMRCLAVPKLGKDHSTELIYNRFISGEEKTYIFLKTNAPYSMFGTSSDVKLGFAILMD